jgi:arsenate reductase
MRQEIGSRCEVRGYISSSVRPEAIAAMKEIGIDISKHQSKSVNEFVGKEFDYIITGDHAKETCPIFPGRSKRIHKADPPPSSVGDYNFRMAIFRQLRDKIRDWIEQFRRG